MVERGVKCEERDKRRVVRGVGRHEWAESAIMSEKKGCSKWRRNRIPTHIHTRHLSNTTKKNNNIKIRNTLCTGRQGWMAQCSTSYSFTFIHLNLKTMMQSFYTLKFNTRFLSVSERLLVHSTRRLSTIYYGIQFQQIRRIGGTTPRLRL